MTTPSLRAATPASPSERSARRIRIGNRLARWDVKASPYFYISPFFILFIIVVLGIFLIRIFVIHIIHFNTAETAFDFNFRSAVACFS